MIIYKNTGCKIQTKNKNVIKEIKVKLTKPNPIFYLMERINKPTYNIPREIIMYEEVNGILIIPRGAITLIKDIVKKYKEFIIIRDERSNGYNINVRFNFNGNFNDLYSYQKELINPTNKKTNGILVAPCGFGKTVSSLGIIVKKKVSTLIIVHTSELMKQWLDEIKSKIKGNFTIGQIGGGKKQLGDITIGMNQTLTRLNKNQFNELNKKFGMVILDEMQHAPASSFLKVIKNLNCKYIYGISATPTRKDGLHFLSYNYIGPIIHKVKDITLEKHNRLVPVKVKYVKTNKCYDFKTMNENFITLNTKISKDQYRNELIIKKVIEDVTNNKFPMILCNRTLQAARFIQMLKNRNYKVGKLLGVFSKKERAKYKKLASSNQLDVLVCIDKLAMEGLNIPPIDTIHIVYPTNNKNNLKQAIGRGRRVYNSKKYCQVYMYQDYIYYEWNNKEYEHRLGRNFKACQLKYFKEFNFIVDDV